MSTEVAEVIHFDDEITICPYCGTEPHGEARHEVMRAIPGAVFGERDGTRGEGRIFRRQVAVIEIKGQGRADIVAYPGDPLIAQQRAGTRREWSVFELDGRRGILI